MLVEFTKPFGPWKTIFCKLNGKDLARIRDAGTSGYQVTVTHMMFEGRFGATNTKYFKTLKTAKNFVEDNAVAITTGVK